MTKQEVYKLLCDKIKEEMNNGTTKIYAYEKLIINTLEKLFNKSWWQITDCDIPKHIYFYKDPYTTAKNVVKKLKENII